MQLTTHLSTRKDEKLSRPGWLTYSGHPSTAGRAQDRDSSPVKDRRSNHCATYATNKRIGRVLVSKTDSSVRQDTVIFIEILQNTGAARSKKTHYFSRKRWNRPISWNNCYYPPPRSRLSVLLLLKLVLLVLNGHAFLVSADYYSWCAFPFKVVEALMALSGISRRPRIRLGF